MSIDPQVIGSGMAAAVPFVRTLGVQFPEVSRTRAVASLPDREAQHNHVGGPHAGALFTLGESASGALVLAAFGDLLDRATPLAAGAEISYRALARGEVSAEAALGGEESDVRAALARGELPQFSVQVTIRDSTGTVTAEMVVRWALKPNKQRETPPP